MPKERVGPKIKILQTTDITSQQSDMIIYTVKGKRTSIIPDSKTTMTQCELIAQCIGLTLFADIGPMSFCSVV